MDDSEMKFGETVQNDFRLTDTTEQNNEFRSWENYTAEFEKKIAFIQTALKIGDADEVNEKIASVVERELLTRCIIENVRFEEALRESGRQLDESTATLLDYQKSVEGVIAEKNREVAYYKSNNAIKNNLIDDLMERIRLISSELAALDRLYLVLVEEADRLYGIDKFEKLKIETMRLEAGKARAAFERSGDPLYRSKLPILRSEPQ
jgi:hypothetical protein